MASSISATTLSKHDFESRIEHFKCPKSDINALILDYLTLEGYPDAAAKFAKEANLHPFQQESAIRSRQEIKQAIHAGNIQSAVDALNLLDPRILEDDPTLHFAILRLQLVELIRTCSATPGSDITPAITFASTHLGPRAPTNPKFLEDLEQTMALLIFPHDKLEPPLAALLKPELRRDVADKVNKAITERQQGRREAAMRDLARMREWSEKAARKAVSRDIPARLDLSLYKEDNDNDGGLNENGPDPMVTT